MEITQFLILRFVAMKLKVAEMSSCAEAVEEILRSSCDALQLFNEDTVKLDSEHHAAAGSPLYSTGTI